MSSGPYQSWLITTIRARSRQLIDQVAASTRHLKVALLWGSQVALYPVYLAVQGSRLAGKQLRQAVRQAVPQLRAWRNPNARIPPDSDQAIQRIMPYLQALELKSEGERPVSTPSIAPALVPPEQAKADPSPIHGVVCCLETRSLALVDQANQVWDGLSLEQQRQLYRHLIWEVIDYDRAMKRFWAVQRGFTLPPLAQQRLPLPDDRPQVLPSARKFWAWVTWMQRSPVATAINLFHEVEDLDASGLGQSDPMGTLVIRPDHDRQAPPLDPLDSAHTWMNPDHYSNQTDLSQGDGQGVTNPLPDRSSWLTISDVFGDPRPQPPLPLESSDLVISQPGKLLTLEDGEQRPIPGSGLSRQVDHGGAATTVRSPPITGNRSVSSSLVAQPPSPSSPPSHSPDWIETDAKSTGYVEHPLEAILGWLDRLLVTLENLGSLAWKLLKQYLRL